MESASAKISHAPSAIGDLKIGIGPTALSVMTASTPNTAAIRSGVSTVARRTLGHQPAAVHHHDAVGKARGEREVVHDREHRAAVARGARSSSITTS